ncbi:orc1/cdc6 family replication initiation protein [Haloferax sp. Q22]|uniref:AAA family ATPase n=1 Tax=Haloferax sp. (strain Q22) TaxID=1526048 RepID=UPI000737C9A3
MDSGGKEQRSLDEMWAAEDPIFERKQLLEIDHIPNEDRIIGRDEEIENIVSSLHPAISGGSPRNTLIYGKTGTGKSLVTKHVTRSAQRYAGNQGVEMGRAYVDCTQSSTETRVVVNLARELNNPERTGISIPETGLSTDAYYHRLWKILDELYDVVIVILDEIDKLQENEVLMQLSRAGEAGKVDSCNLGIIAISNKISFKKSLDERVLSSLQDTEFIFPPYDANQLRAIMENRKDAFRPGVITDDVIPLCAAYAAQEHGDARKALDILRNAGELAKNSDAEQVTDQHVKDARDKADMDRFAALLKDQPTQAKAPILALAALVESKNEAEFSSNEIYEIYRYITNQLDMDTLSQRRMNDRLNEAVFLDILGRTERVVGRGRGRGVTPYLYHLLEDADIVQAVILRDSRFEPLGGQPLIP